MKYIMKKVICLCLLMPFFIRSFAQVSFSSFKFIKDSPFGCCPGRKGTTAKFKVTGEERLKYVWVYYYGINNLGDAVSSDIVGAVNANVEHTKNKAICMSGPFEPGKSYSRFASATFLYPDKVSAFPFQIKLIYFDSSEKIISITENNYKEYFPCIKKWIDVNLTDGL